MERSPSTASSLQVVETASAPHQIPAHLVVLAVAVGPYACWPTRLPALVSSLPLAGRFASLGASINPPHARRLLVPAPSVWKPSLTPCWPRVPIQWRHAPRRLGQ